MANNPNLTCEINDLLHDGRGVGRVNGKAYFIEGALPDEEVEFFITKEKRNFGEGRVSRVLKPSQHREKPDCNYFSRCGGCSLQHLNHEKQVEFKSEQLLTSLERSSLKVSNILDPVMGPSWGYRRRARLAVQRSKSGQFLVGFRNSRSSRIEPIETCLTLDGELNKILLELPFILDAVPRSIKLLEIELVAADNALAIAVESNKKLPLQIAGQLSQRLSDMSGMAKQLWWKDKHSKKFECLTVDFETLFFKIEDDIKIYFEPGQFIQVNHTVNQHLIKQMLNLLSPSLTGTAVDLYCGSGNLSLALASYFDRVVGLEGLQSLVAGAIENAKRNVIGNVEFAVVDLGDIKSLEKAVENLGVIDLVVLDPPRGGAADIMPWIAKSGASQVVYVSCHPSTMLRDAHVLEESGYKMLNLGVLDMFPHSSHIESISLFVK